MQKHFKEKYNYSKNNYFLMPCFNEELCIETTAKRLLEVEEDDILNTQIQQFCDSSGEFCFSDKITEFKGNSHDNITEEVWRKK